MVCESDVKEGPPIVRVSVGLWVTDFTHHFIKGLAQEGPSTIGVR